jgi:hypothetical protein
MMQHLSYGVSLVIGHHCEDAWPHWSSLQEMEWASIYQEGMKESKKPLCWRWQQFFYKWVDIPFVQSTLDIHFLLCAFIRNPNLHQWRPYREHHIVRGSENCAKWSMQKLRGEAQVTWAWVMSECWHPSWVFSGLHLISNAVVLKCGVGDD